MRFHGVKFRPGEPKKAIVATISQKTSAEARREFKGYKDIKTGCIVVRISNLD
jgi:hypothetical protein